VKSNSNIEQLRGAYSAGHEAGLKMGIEKMRNDGWMRNLILEIPEVGEVVKSIEPTLSGWTGIGRVISADSNGVRLLQLNKLNGELENDNLRTVDLCLHQIARKKS
jgi:hypothetical protein